MANKTGRGKPMIAKAGFSQDHRTYGNGGKLVKKNTTSNGKKKSK